MDAFAHAPAIGGAALASRLGIALGYDLLPLVQQLQGDLVASLDRQLGLPDQTHLHYLAGDSEVVQHSYFA